MALLRSNLLNARAKFMQILHKIDDFLFALFPSVHNGDEEGLKEAIQQFYTFGTHIPKVSIEDGWVKIEIDTRSILSNEQEYRKVIALCEKGKFAEAKPILSNLIAKNPTNSEYHRIMGQILSDEGDQDEAINSLIDALRWDSKNGWALLMMGNIFAKFKNDVPTAMIYYDQAMVANPKDNITMNNIGANLMQQGKLREARKYFDAALAIDGKYPNTHFALGMLAEIDGDLLGAFHHTIKALEVNPKKDALYQNSIKQAFESAQKIIKEDTGRQVYLSYHDKLVKEGNRQINIVEDGNIPTAAKFEFAENYNRKEHLVRYNPAYPAFEHLIMHELVHLDLVIQARNAQVNQLYITKPHHKAEFIKSLGSSLRKFQQMGISEQSISNYCSELFEGINRQIFNAPIDLFIEQFLFDNYPSLRPFQFLSLYTMVREGLRAVTEKEIVELSPKDVLSKSKIYNLVGAIQFKNLFGIDLISEYKATPNESKTAFAFYEEFEQYKSDKEPGEEYELVIHWAKDLDLDKYFELVDEAEYHNRTSSLDEVLSSIEADPFGLHSEREHKAKEHEQFQKTQEQIGTNMAVVMYMVEALQYFEGMTKEAIKNTAFEIALQGTHGYSPDKDGYKVSSIKGKTFSGYHILAYYYISWALAIPEMLAQLQLPYDDEYQMALSLYKPNQS
jgi:tetratricopeptide (TPR) repeat protein